MRSNRPEGKEGLCAFLNRLGKGGATLRAPTSGAAAARPGLAQRPQKVHRRVGVRLLSSVSLVWGEFAVLKNHQGNSQLIQM